MSHVCMYMYVCMTLQTKQLEKIEVTIYSVGVVAGIEGISEDHCVCVCVCVCVCMCTL